MGMAVTVDIAPSWVSTDTATFRYARPSRNGTSVTRLWLRADGSTAEDYEEGKRVYYQNCLPCHGDGLDGNGHYAHGFTPRPLPFTGSGTIAQLTESFVFWRVAKGGPGLPREGAPWNSAMPAWEDILTADEIWAVIVFLYEQTGATPRTWEEAGGEEHE